MQLPLDSGNLLIHNRDFGSPHLAVDFDSHLVLAFGQGQLRRRYFPGRLAIHIDGHARCFGFHFHVAHLGTQYMQLTEAEAVFRALKSELSIRPLFHQLEPRVKAHVMVAFLGYALWVTLKHLLKRRPPIVPKQTSTGVDNVVPLSPMQAIALLSTLQSADIILPTTDGRELRLRRVTEPDPEQRSLLHQLRISLPERFELNRKCSVDSAIA